MKVSKNKVVSLHYELRLNDLQGEMVEKTNEDKPLTFIYGVGQMLQKFEENLDGSAKGDDFNFILQPAEAYGEFMQENVVDVPKTAFEVDGKIDDKTLFLNNRIAMQDGNGNRFVGTVKEIGDANVSMDFNHPMAGKTLCFKGEIIELRDATPEELQEVHGDGCSGDCSSGGCNC